MAYIGKVSANPADREDENMRVSGEMLEMERVDADLHRQGRDDDLRAMQDNGSTLEIPITEAVGEKHIHGFAIAHVQEANASWRLVATDVRTELREDNHQGSPPLMIASATLSCASSCFKEVEDTNEGYENGTYAQCSTQTWMRHCTCILDTACVNLVTVGCCGKLCLGESGTLTSCDGLGWQGVSEKRLRMRFTSH